VVATLFGQVRPDSAWFGEKDWQQVQVIRRMVRDLLLPVTIETAPTWREADGLAMSSRNRYLSVDDRARAPALFRVLETVRRRLRDGGSLAPALADGRADLDSAGLTVDYLAVVDETTLEPLDRIGAHARLIAAARLGGTRLLDNVAL
jgi:pantoate--beta-alanine ligase